MALKTFGEFRDEFISLAMTSFSARMPGVDTGSASAARMMVEAIANAHAQAMLDMQAKFWMALSTDAAAEMLPDIDTSMNPKPTGIRTKQPKRFKR